MIITSVQSAFLQGYYINYLTEEINKIEDIYEAEVDTWIKGNFRIKLLILAEAPLSSSQYFYKEPKSFLSGVRQYFDIKQKTLIEDLRYKGVFVLDIYKFPVNPRFYVDDKKLCLYDNEFIREKIGFLESELLDKENYAAVFRYQNLIDRKLYNKNALKNLKYLKKKDHTHARLYVEERPSGKPLQLSPEVQSHLK